MVVAGGGLGGGGGGGGGLGGGGGCGGAGAGISRDSGLVPVTSAADRDPHRPQVPKRKKVTTQDQLTDDTNDDATD